MKVKFRIVLLIGITNLLFGCFQRKNKNLVLTEDNHNLYYEKGTKFIEPYMSLEGKNIIIDSNSKYNINEGIRYLNAVTTINPNNFAAYWIKGKGYQSLNQHDSAYYQFSKSFEIKKDNPDVARELMIECLYLGKGKEAVEVSLHALTLDSLNAGLVGNLALSYLINGNLELAEKTIVKAIKIDSIDQVNLSLSKIINDVVVGKRKIPSKYDDIIL